jgi:hypothetical protein
LAVCPEKWKKFRDAVRIRTLRTQQRAISQCREGLLCCANNEVPSQINTSMKYVPDTVNITIYTFWKYSLISFGKDKINDSLFVS